MTHVFGNWIRLKNKNTYFMEIETKKHLSRLYMEYYERSCLFVKSYVRDEMAAEDIASDAWMKLVEVAEEENVDNALALLTYILKNKSLNYLKHQKIECEVKENISSKRVRDVEYRISSLEACNPDELFSEEITRIVRQALDDLPAETRRIFVMRRFRQMSVKEIAATLKLSPKSVEYHITKSLKLLRVALKDYLPLFYLLAAFPK